MTELYRSRGKGINELDVRQHAMNQRHNAPERRIKQLHTIKAQKERQVRVRALLSQLRNGRSMNAPKMPETTRMMVRVLTQN